MTNYQQYLKLSKYITVTNNEHIIYHGAMKLDKEQLA